MCLHRYLMPYLRMNLLPYFFLNKEKIRQPKYLVFIFILLVAFSVSSYFIGKGVALYADFTVFWQAGKNFSEGLSLYSRVGGAERYIYPPFAAMCFQSFSWLSLQQAATVFCFFNHLCWILIIYYTKQILILVGFAAEQSRAFLFIAFILSFRYFLYHISFMQMNELVLLLSLLGCYYHLINKNNQAILVLVVATFIKIIPIFILLWVLRKCKVRKYLLSIFVASFCVLVPLAVRGIAQGSMDISEYYTTFLEPFKQGRVEPNMHNYALNAALYKIFSYTEDGAKHGYIISLLSPKTIDIIYKTIALFLLAGFFWILNPFKKESNYQYAYHISFILMMTHLISGITWEYHLVSLFFVLSVVASDYLNAQKTQKKYYYLLGAFLLFNSLIGSDTVGFYLFYKSCGYSFLTWQLLVLAGYMLYKSVKKQKTEHENFS